MDELLTRFTVNHPCWTRELLILAGEDANDLNLSLEELKNAGLLQDEDNIYWLTEDGKARFQELARACYLDETPGNKPGNLQRSLTLTKMYLHLERCNRQVGGEKKYLLDVSIPIRPAIKPLFSLNENKLHWLWPENGLVLETKKEFPLIPPNERTLNAGKWKDWCEKTPIDSDPLRLDLILLAHYDMIHYLDFKGHPNDSYHLINTDRFCFVMADNVETCLKILGQVHLWLHELRRVAIPGYLDVDTQQQDSANWLIFVTEDEKTAISLADKLAVYGNELLAPAMPMELWTISLESLEQAPNGRDVIWELLPFISHAVWPPRKIY